jgi:hypothetical protein
MISQNPDVELMFTGRKECIECAEILIKLHLKGSNYADLLSGYTFIIIYEHILVIYFLSDIFLDDF